MSNLSESFRFRGKTVCVVFDRNQNLNELESNDIIQSDMKLVQRQQSFQEHVAFMSIDETVETR